MKRLSNVLWAMVIVVALFMLYKVKYQVLALKQEVAATAQELRQEQDALRVVSAEWAYLNRPQRLQQLAAKYLASTDVTVNQIAEIEEIPFPSQSMAALEPSAGIKPVSAKVTGGGR
jgi:hypothetical protein